MNSAEAEWGGQWQHEEEMSMGGSQENAMKEVMEITKPPGVEAVMEGGIWKVLPKQRVLGDFVQLVGRKTSQQHQKNLKRSKFCDSFGCGVADCGELHMVGTELQKNCDMLMREEAQAFKSKGGINTAGRNGWEKVEIQIDSGAIDTVAPKTVGGHLPIKETEAVRRKIGYVAANGTKIANYGERMLRGTTKDGATASMAVQVADVSRTLGSVTRMNEAGNVVVLDGHESYTLNKSTGRITSIDWKDGKFIMDLWLQVPQQGRQAAEVSTQNRFEALAAVEEEEEDIEECRRYETLVGSPGFNWRDTLW